MLHARLRINAVAAKQQLLHLLAEQDLAANGPSCVWCREKFDSVANAVRP